MRFQESFHNVIDKEGYDVNEVKKSYFELNIDALVNIKTKLIFALEDPDETYTKPESIASVGNLDLNK